MGKNLRKQFNLEKRATLARLINKGYTALAIAVVLGMDPTSVSRELKRNRILKREAILDGSLCSTCLYQKGCNIRRVCDALNCSMKCNGCKSMKSCRKYAKFECKKTTRFPFVCNGCSRENNCPLEQYHYYPDGAHTMARERLVSTREGANLTEEERQAQDAILIDAVIEKKQSIHHALIANKKVLNCSEKTLYRRIGKGIYTVRYHHLPRQVTLKKRKIKPKYEYVHDPKVDRTGHLYSDWLVYRFKNGITFYFQMDFLGAPKKSKKEILVLNMPEISFVLLYIIEDKNQSKVIELFNSIQEKLGIEDFKKLFPAILTDRDTVFDDFESLETNKDGEVRTKIFFCNPGESNQKPSVENINGQMRIVFPKHALLDDYIQEDLYLAASNLNSRYLSSIDNRTPYDLFKEIFGEEILNKLNIKKIPAQEVKLKPIH